MRTTMNFPIVLLLVAAMVFTSCEGYLEDYHESPNNPVTATPALLLSSAEVATFATYTGQLVRQSCTFNQQLAGTDAGSQSIEIANYNITEGTNTNEWGALYSGAIADCQQIISEFGGESPHYRGMARVIMAMNAGLASDLWGDVPFSQAGLANIDGNFSPVYDSQQDIMQTLIPNLLDAAIADFALPASANTNVPAGDDLIYGGDVTLWTQLAHAVKARYANRLSSRDASGSATKALASVSSAFTSSGDDAFASFPGGATGQNQWFAFEANRGGYYRVNATFSDLLTANGDPRQAFFMGADENGGFSGTPFDNTADFSTSYLGAMYASETAPFPLATYVEMKFIEAEANLRLGNGGDAASAYNEAVIASVTQVTGAAPDAAFVTAYADEDGTTINLDKIMTQKWIALFAQVESYSDWRRTGIPSLTSNPNAATGIPLRLPTVRDERLYNENAVVEANVEQPVWWDND